SEWLRVFPAAAAMRGIEGWNASREPTVSHRVKGSLRACVQIAIAPPKNGRFLRACLAMSAPAPRVSPIAFPLLPHVWWVLLLAAMALHGCATVRRIDRVEAMTNLSSWSVDAPARDANSPTGFVHGQRTLIVPRH